MMLERKGEWHFQMHTDHFVRYAYAIVSLQLHAFASTELEVTDLCFRSDLTTSLLSVRCRQSRPACS